MPKPVYVLDTFAIIAFLQDEAGATKVEAILKKGKAGKVKLYLHNINLGEIYYQVFRNEGEHQANAVLTKVKRYPVEFIEDFSEELMLTAARLKATYPISYADAIASATAIQKSGSVITGDPDFKLLEQAGKVKVFWIRK